jgi:hypothetical protein
MAEVPRDLGLSYRISMVERYSIIYGLACRYR